MTKANETIRKAAKEKGVYLWQVVEALGINDGNFSRLLRRELPEAKQNEIIEIINQIAEINKEN